MKTPLLLIGCLLIISVATNAFAAAQPNLQGTLHNDTTVLFLGKTSVTATFPGYPMSALVDASIAEGMDTFTLLGSQTFADLHDVVVAEDIDISQADTFEELFLRYADLPHYTNVTITTDTGLFFLEYPTGGTIKVKQEVAFAISSFFSVTLNHTTIPFFLIETQTPVTLAFSGGYQIPVFGVYAILAHSDITGTIRVQDQQGNIVWSGHSPNDYLLIRDQRFHITQQPPISLYPLDPKDDTSQMLSYSIAPTSQSIDLSDLLENVTAQAKHFADTSISPAFSMIQDFTALISKAPFLANGAMILGDTNDTFMIDHSPQTFQRYGFVRIHDLTVTPQPDSGPAFQGTYSLVFLGDHFYNPQAQHSGNGIAFPYLLLIIWVIAIAIFLYIRFFLKPTVDPQRDSTLKKYALYIHIILLIIAFLFLDWGVNTQLGVSALTSLATQGAATITGLCLGLELILWVLGYFLLALPVRLIINSGLGILHVGKGGRGLGAGMGDLMIGVFAVLYLLLVFNIIVSVFHLSSLFTTG